MFIQTGSNAIQSILNLHRKIYSKIPFLNDDFIARLEKEILEKASSASNKVQKETFVILKDDEPLAGLVLFYQESFNAPFSKPTVLFNYFVSEENSQACKMLFETVQKYCVTLGINRLTGPMTPYVDSHRGLAMDQNAPAFGMPYHPPYFESLLLENGFKIQVNLFQIIFDTNPPFTLLKNFSKLCKLRLGKKIQVRKINTQNLNDEFSKIVELYNETWKNNEGFIPLYAEDLTSLAKDLTPIYNDDFGCLIEADGKLAAFLMCIPDYYSNNSVRIFFIGVHPDWQRKGLEVLLFDHVFNEVIAKRNFSKIHAAWIVESNKKLLGEIQKINSRFNKNSPTEKKLFRIYEKPF